MIREDVSGSTISIPAGILIGLLASFVQSLGLTIQRKSHVLNQQLPEERRKPDYRRPLWILGFAVFISSNILGSLVQIASLPVVILAPLGAVSLLWNAFFARLLLGDVFSLWMILGTIFIAGGAVLIAVFGIVPEPTRSLEDLMELFRRPAFVAYFSLLGAFVVVCLAITHITEYSFSRRLVVVKESPTPPLSPLDTPAALTTSVTDNALTVATEHTPLLDRKPSTSSSPIRLAAPSASVNRTRILLAISYASFSGIISGMCLVFAKSGVELLVLTLHGHNQFNHVEAWMLVLGLAVFALLQLWYLHKALTLADPTLVCPSAFCFYNLSSIINGLVYFNQFSLIPPLHLGLVVLGILVLLAGVWVVSIHAGGGGVDLNAWQANDDDDIDNADGLSGSCDDDEEALIGDESAPDDSMLLRGRGPGSETATRRLSSIRIDNPSLSPELRASALSRQATGSTNLSPGTSRRRRRTATLLASLGDLNRSSQGSNSMQPPLSPTLSTGLSIGLSPMSPGFAPVPLERRRRVSGMSITDVVDEVQRRRHSRRSVSVEGTGADSPLHHRSSTATADDEAGGGVPLAIDSVEEGEGDQGFDNERGGDGAAATAARFRWKWLKRALRK